MINYYFKELYYVIGMHKIKFSQKIFPGLSQNNFPINAMITRFAIFQKRRIAPFTRFLHPLPTVSSRPGIQSRISQPPFSHPLSQRHFLFIAGRCTGIFKDSKSLRIRRINNFQMLISPHYYERESESYTRVQNSCRDTTQ